MIKEQQISSTNILPLFFKAISGDLIRDSIKKNILDKMVQPLENKGGIYYYNNKEESYGEKILKEVLEDIEKITPEEYNKLYEKTRKIEEIKLL